MRNDDDARTRAIEIAEEIERLASQAAPLTEQERIRLLRYIETADIDALAAEAEAGYDPDKMVPRRRRISG